MLVLLPLMFCSFLTSFANENKKILIIFFNNNNIIIIIINF